jgi:hypothetical protein
MHITNLATGVGAIFGVLVLIVSALAVSRDSYARSRIKALQGDRDDLIVRSDLMDKEIESQNVKIAILQRELAAEESARKVLERAVTGRDLMEEMGKDLAAHNKASMDALQKVFTAIQEMTDVLDQIQRGSAR